MMKLTDTQIEQVCKVLRRHLEISFSVSPTELCCHEDEVEFATKLVQAIDFAKDLKIIPLSDDQYEEGEGIWA